MAKRNLAGQRFGKLVVLRRSEKTAEYKHSSDYWLCRCDCGNETVVLGSNLTSGHKKIKHFERSALFFVFVSAGHNIV